MVLIAIRQTRRGDRMTEYEICMDGTNWYCSSTADNQYGTWTPVEKLEEPKPVVINININAQIVIKIVKEKEEKGDG